MTKKKPGDIIEDWKEFIQLVIDGEDIFFHGQQTKGDYFKNWQLATILRYLTMRGSLRKAVNK